MSVHCHTGRIVGAVLAVALCGGFVHAAEFQVVPPQLVLSGNFAQAQLLVLEETAPGQVSERSADLTHRAEFLPADPSLVTITSTGRLLAVKDGQTSLTVSVAGVSKTIPVTVTGVLPEPKIDFQEHLLPLIAKLGCNGGACHASQHGKGGFTLSVFGYDPQADHRAVLRDRMQRRVNLNSPSDSLLLKKPTLSVPHGGGKRLDPHSTDYQVLLAWIAAGAPAPRADVPRITRIAVTPSRKLAEVGQQQQLRVEATDSAGQTRDVTHWARFDTLDEGVVQVGSNGLLTVAGKGQAAVMVRYEGQAEIAMVTVPYAPTAPLAGWTSNNFVDELAAAKFQELGIVPSGLCDDATFLRRAYLDATGTLPTVDEATAFLQSADPQKRSRVIDRLLGLTGDPALDTFNDKYAGLWTIRWADLIRNNSDEIGEQGMWAMHNWLRESFRTNRPFNQFVSELITARGSIFSNGPANYFRINKSPADLGETTAQLFLGTRLGCAKCHHHPFEKYSQDDYYGFAAFFARVGTKNSQEFGLFGAESVVVVRTGGEVGNPKTGKVMKPTPLDAEPVDDPRDRRIALAKWLTAPENEAFSRNVANRYMRFLLGRGLVEPVDDMRATNPPTNPALLTALAIDFRDSGFNVKHLMRTIMNSRLYQLDSQPTPDNVSDDRFYSHFFVKRIPAEPLLDAIDDVTQSPTKYPNLPLGTRAIDLPDADHKNFFLATFGKPKRVSICECERVPDENLSQALHTLNGDILANKIADGKGRIAQLLAAQKPHDAIVAELYLAALSRQPTAEELAASQKFLAEAGSPAECYQDLLWALINSKQFLFVH